MANIEKFKAIMRDGFTFVLVDPETEGAGKITQYYLYDQVTDKLTPVDNLQVLFKWMTLVDCEPNAHLVKAPVAEA